MKSVILHAPDISCSHCEKTIKKVLGQLPGMQKVAVDIPTQAINLQYDEAVLDPKTIESALAQEGYPVQAAAPQLSSKGRSSCCGSCTL